MNIKKDINPKHQCSIIKCNNFFLISFFRFFIIIVFLWLMENNPILSIAGHECVMCTSCV